MLPEYFALLMFGFGFLALVVVCIPVTAVIHGVIQYHHGAPFVASVMHCLRNF
ncbi:hypothetical protein [Neptunomonas japonica]|uniref:hypothetical protein n=1 Tax=Neptunomonas japonica TaxID=417574 RepID=UPI0004245EED|nr:hypothetical protein [Neptunomonas japonica]